MSANTHRVFQRHRLDVSDYYRMAEAGILGEDDRCELIEGEIIDMAPYYFGSIDCSQSKDTLTSE